jgi:hypothetical protein
MQFCACGQVLLLAVEDATVRLVSGEEITFRRSTDHVTCPQCLLSYPIEAIRTQALAGRGSSP